MYIIIIFIYALRVVSMDTILGFTNTLIIIEKNTNKKKQKEKRLC